jgi:hypothetical protein
MFFALSCSLEPRPSEAIVTADAYLAALRERDFDTAVSYQRPAADGSISAESADRMTLAINRIGPPTSFQVVGWRLETVEREDGRRAEHVLLFYQVRYRSESSRDTIALYREDSSSRFLIVGHRIRAPSLESLDQSFRGGNGRSAPDR